MRDQSNKNKYFFAMSPFKVVYLCTLYQYQFSLAYCEWLSMCSTSRHLRTVWKLLVFFFSRFFFSFALKVSKCKFFDDTVETKNKDWTVLDTVKGNPGSNGPKKQKKKQTRIKVKI